MVESWDLQQRLRFSDETQVDEVSCGRSGGASIEAVAGVLRTVLSAFKRSPARSADEDGIQTKGDMDSASERGLLSRLSVAAGACILFNSNPGPEGAPIIDPDLTVWPEQTISDHAGVRVGIRVAGGPRRGVGTVVIKVEGVNAR